MREPFLADPDVTLYLGDAREVLAEMPAESVDMACTSPPFFGLRNYQVEGQIGLEASPDEWVGRLVDVFREVRRVLRPHGLMFVECGDSYGSSGNGGTGEASSKQNTTRGSNHGGMTAKPRLGTKPKDLLGQPWLLAFALRADGWWLRQCIIWSKPNAMPESVRDRCTTAHSYVFLLSKSPRYFFDADAIAEPAAWERWGDQTTPKHGGTETAAGWIKPKTKAELTSLLYECSTCGVVKTKTPASAAEGCGACGGALVVADNRYVNPGNRSNNGQKERTDERRGFDQRLERADAMKNARSVWTIPTQGFPEAHFATFPEELARRCILAGCPEWVCETCGKPRERIVEREFIKTRGNAGPNISEDPAGYDKGSKMTHPLGYGRYNIETLGWSDCGHGGYRPGVVVDPFVGSGTTCLVARKRGRRSIGVDLNPDYLEMAARRLQQLSLLAEATG